MYQASVVQYTSDPMNEPHWLVQELAGEAVWTALAVGAALAWKKREALMRALTRQPIVKNAAAHIKGTSSVTARAQKIQLPHLRLESWVAQPTVTVGSERQILYDVHARVGSERKAMWNIEAPTHPQVKRIANELLELGLWYLRS